MVTRWRIGGKRSLQILFAAFIGVVITFSPVQRRQPAAGQAVVSVPLKSFALAGYVPPSMTKVAVQGEYAYVAAGPALMIFGITDPDHPKLAGRLVLTALIQDMAVSGSYAYILAQDNGVFVVDVSRPNSLAICGIYASSGYNWYSLAAKDDYIFLAGGGGMRILSMANPISPRLITDFPARWVGSILVSGDYVYLTQVKEDWVQELWVVDIKNIQQPIKTGTLELDWILNYVVEDMSLDGQILALAVEKSSDYMGTYFLLVDISDPSNPKKVVTMSPVESGDNPSIAISSNLVVATSRNKPIHVFDVTSPENPSEIAIAAVPAHDMAIKGNFIYVAAGGSGFAIVDVSTPSQPIVRGEYPGIGYVMDVAINDKTLFVANGGDDAAMEHSVRGGLAVIDVRQPSLASVVAKATLTGGYEWLGGNRIAINGDYAYLTADSGFSRPTRCNLFLQSYDISQPDIPIPLDNISVSYDLDECTGYPLDPIVITGTSVLMGGHMDELYVIDISQPMTLTQLTQFLTVYPVFGIATDSHYAYLAENASNYNESSEGLRVLDITDPTNPTHATFYSLVDPMDVIIRPPYAYIASGSAGIRILDISNIHQIISVGQLDTPGTATKLALNGDYLYVADGEAGLRMIDISQPNTPVEVASFDTPGNARGVAVDDEYVYIADETGGLFILTLAEPVIYFPVVLR